MSFLSLSGLTAADPALGQSALPPVNPALEPAQVRNGPPAAKQAYQEGLAFEEMLLDQLSQELVSTVSDPDGSDGTDSSDGSDDSGDDSGDAAGGLMGSDPASSEYASMLPGVLTSSIMAGGGTGMALQLATALDPALANPPSSAKAGGHQ